MKTPFFIGRTHFCTKNWEYGSFSVRKLIFSPENQRYQKIIYFSIFLIKKVEIDHQSSIIKYN